MLSRRTYKQIEQLKLLKSVYFDLADCYIGNCRELAALAKIRDAIAVLEDPKIVYSDDPEDEPILVERYFETVGSNRVLEINIDINMPDSEIYDSLLRYLYIVHKDIIEINNDKCRADNIRDARRALLKYTDVSAKVVQFPIAKRPPLSD